MKRAATVAGAVDETWIQVARVLSCKTELEYEELQKKAPYSGPSKVQLSTKKVQLFACATAHKGKIGRSNMLKKGAARFARRAFFDGVGPSNFAFVCRGTSEKLDLFGRKLDL